MFPTPLNVNYCEPASLNQSYKRTFSFVNKQLLLSTQFISEYKVPQYKDIDLPLSCLLHLAD